LKVKKRRKKLGSYYPIRCRKSGNAWGKR